MSTKGLWAPPRFYGPPEVVLLTPAQFDITRLLCRGMSNREIGRASGLAEDTVKTHLRQVFKRMRCRERTEVAVKLHSRQMIIRESYRPRGDVVDTR